MYDTILFSFVNCHMFLYLWNFYLILWRHISLCSFCIVSQNAIITHITKARWFESALNYLLWSLSRTLQMGKILQIVQILRIRKGRDKSNLSFRLQRSQKYFTGYEFLTSMHSSTRSCVHLFIIYEFITI